MECGSARLVISAQIDGEASADELGGLDAHLVSCEACRSWQAGAHDLRRSVTMRQAVPPPELANRVMARLVGPETGVGEWVRYALAVVAAALVVLNLPLLLGLAEVAADHDGRHLGTFGVALGIGLGWAAVRPERAIGLVPLALALGAATLVSALVDLGAGRTAAAAEATHVLELVGLVLLWMLSGGVQRFRHLTRGLRTGQLARSA